MSIFQYQSLAEPIVAAIPAPPPAPELSWFQSASQPVLPKVRARLGYFIQPLEVGGYMPMVMPPVGEVPFRRRCSVAATEIVEPLAVIAWEMPLTFLFAETSQPIIRRKRAIPGFQFNVTAPPSAAMNATVVYISLTQELSGGHL